MDVNATCSFEPVDERILRMIVIEHDEEGYNHVIEIVEINLDDPRRTNIGKLMDFDLNSGLDFILGFRTHWPVSLKGTRDYAARMGRILDAYPGKGACGPLIDLEQPKPRGPKKVRTRDSSAGLQALMADGGMLPQTYEDDDGRCHLVIKKSG
jgi:hypothetical protein